MGIEQLEVFDSTSHALNAIIDTPKGNRNKYKYDEKYRAFFHLVHFHARKTVQTNRQS